MEEEILHNWEKKSADHQKLYKQYLHRADKRKVLKLLPDLHEEAFEKINCLKCANCCKTYSPRFKTPDIKRIAKYLKMKEGDFINTYLFVDSEGDYVLKSKPCPFLGADNYCAIYESRPNVTADAAALCVKSGNAVILRGGKEAAHSNRAIAQKASDGALPFDSTPNFSKMALN